MMRLLRFLRGLYHRLRAVYWGPDVDSIRQLEREGRLDIGPHTYGRPTVRTHMMSHSRLIIGDYSSLHDTAIIMLGGEHAVDRVSTWPVRILMGLPGAGEDGVPRPTEDTVIGSDVWLTTNTFVRTGVRIGDGAVIAAGAVVVSDVPPFAIVGGNPAKVIRYRFDEAQREALLDLRWWDWRDEEVRLAADLIAGDDVDAFIKYAYARRDEVGDAALYR